jgi:hypothetical protein
VEIAVVKKILHEADGLDMRGRELINMHRLLIEVARMKEFDAKREIVRRPERLVAAETDFAVFVVVEVVLTEDAGQVGARRMEGHAGAFQRPLRHIVQTDVGGFRGQAGRADQQAAN